MHAPVNVRSDVNNCIRKIEGGRKVVLLGYMNGRVGCNEIARVVGNWGVGVNEDGEHLVDICVERGLFVVNTFQYKMILRFTWRGR